MFIFRALFVVLLAALLLPLVPVKSDAEEAKPLAVYAELYGMLRATTSDLLAFCDREPDVCVRASTYVDGLQLRAAHLTGEIHDWLEARLAERETAG
ncbi:MAG: hypothetical protein H6923_01010 [Alphaproteobacteria bacterium]|nr:hypothetical protein [Alphaproteobacteria bacterium]